jgi:hypothetical protein
MATTPAISNSVARYHRHARDGHPADKSAGTPLSHRRQLKAVTILSVVIVRVCGRSSNHRTSGLGRSRLNRRGMITGCPA